MSTRPQTAPAAGPAAGPTGAAQRTDLAAAERTAAVLVEALPYIRRFSGRVVVIKQGGAAIAGGGGLAGFAEDVVLMSSVGIKPVVVHGGGPQIGEWMARLGKVPEFREGMRVTDAETLDIARMVLVGKVNGEIVRAINTHGSLAVGLSGEDGGLIRAEAHPGGLGYVGEVVSVDPTVIERLLAEGLIPVVATIASDEAGQAYNVNADLVAGAVAGALGAEKLVHLTDVEGLRRDPADPGSLIASLGVAELEAMIEGRPRAADPGTLGGGMLPKAISCVRALRAGVRRAHILDGRVEHALLLELFTEAGFGTMVEE